MQRDVELSSCLQGIVDDESLKKMASDESSIILKELQASMSVKITGLPPSATTIRMNRIGHSPGLKKGGKWNHICDYLVVTRLNDDCHAIFIELKKTLRGDNRAKEQLRRSLPVLDYLVSVCNIEYKKASKPSIKYLLVAQKLSESLDKQRTKIDPSILTSKEEYESIIVITSIKPKIDLAELVKN